MHHVTTQRRVRGRRRARESITSGDARSILVTWRRVQLSFLFFYFKYLCGAISHTAKALRSAVRRTRKQKCFRPLLNISNEILGGGVGVTQIYRDTVRHPWSRERWILDDRVRQPLSTAPPSCFHQLGGGWVCWCMMKVTDKMILYTSYSRWRRGHNG